VIEILYRLTAVLKLHQVLNLSPTLEYAVTLLVLGSGTAIDETAAAASAISSGTLQPNHTNLGSVLHKTAGLALIVVKSSFKAF
jgi:hypothetical protein